MCFPFHDDKSQAEIDILTLQTFTRILFKSVQRLFFPGILALPNAVMLAKPNGLSDKEK